MSNVIPHMSLSFETFLAKPTFEDVMNAYETKGVYSMESFATAVCSFFDACGIDIRDKVIGDAPQPLFIVASNLTKGVPTLFTKDVPILTALQCSCCIPGLFRPQIVYDQVYVDGGVFVPCLSWLQPDAFVLTLAKQTTHLTPSKLITLSPLGFAHSLYTSAYNLFVEQRKTENVLCLSYPNLHSDTDLTTMDLQPVLEHARSELRRFLRSKSLLQEGSKV